MVAVLPSPPVVTMLAVLLAPVVMLRVFPDPVVSAVRLASVQAVVGIAPQLRFTTLLSPVAVELTTAPPPWMLTLAVLP